MSQQNIALVREHFENTNRRDFEKVMELYDPNVELLVSEDVSVDPGTYRGTEAVGDWFGSWFRTFAPGYRLDVAELIAGDDVVVVAVDHLAVGRLSGVEVTTRFHNAYWFRGNKIARVELFRERSDALEAAGLEEETAGESASTSRSLEVVKRIYEAINQEDMDAAFELMTTDVEWVNPPEAVEAGTHIGHQGFAAAVANIRETFAKFEYLLDSAEEHGSQVLVMATFRGRRRAGDEMSWPRHHVWTLRGGKVCRFRWFNHAQAARAAARPSGHET